MAVRADVQKRIVFAVAHKLLPQDQRNPREVPFVNTNALDVFIECFSEYDGDLIYDHDCLPGRMLTDHDLFFVRDGSGEVHTHILNADDHFIGYDDKMDVPFAEPILQVGTTLLGLN